MEYAAQTSQSYFDDRDHPFNFPGTLHIKTWCLYTKRRGIHSENKDQQYHEPNLIGTMSTLDQFFLYYTSMKLPSQCEVDVKIMFFEQDCQPSWEAWQHSGSLLLQFKESKQNNEPQALDQIWQYLLFSMIGNRLDSDVIGLCLNKHQKQTLIQIWLRRLNRKYELADSILKMISSDLWHVVRKFSRKLEFKYTQHRESIKKQSTMKCAQHLKQK